MLLALLVASFALAACGDDDDEGESARTSGDQQAAIQRNEQNASTEITVGSKNFTEQKVLGEIYNSN